MDKQKLDVVFLGEDAFSNVVLQSLIAAGHHVKLVITPWYDNLIWQNINKRQIRDYLILSPFNPL